MKKIQGELSGKDKKMYSGVLFTLLLISFCFFKANAFELHLELGDQGFYLNQIKEISPIIINVDSGSIITKNKGFSLVITEDYNFRFLNDLSKINISGSGASKIGTGFSLTPDLRSIKFNILEDLKSGDNLVISGIQIITFKPQGFKYIGIDVNGDLQADYQTYNGVRIYENYVYSDIYSPAEIFNLTGTIDSENNIKLNADMPGDIDFQAVLIENLDLNDKVVSSYFKTNIKDLSYKLTNDIKKIRFKTVDFRANYSSGLVYSVNYFSATTNGLNPTENTQTGTTSQTGVLTQTGSVTSSTGTIINIQTTTVEVIVIDKYLPIFYTKSYALFMIKFDNELDKKEYKKEVREIRNAIIKILKDYEDKKISISFVKDELKRLVLEFRKIW